MWKGSTRKRTYRHYGVPTDTSRRFGTIFPVRLNVFWALTPKSASSHFSSNASPRVSVCISAVCVTVKEVQWKWLFRNNFSRVTRSPPLHPATTLQERHADSHVPTFTVPSRRSCCCVDLILWLFLMLGVFMLAFFSLSLSLFWHRVLKKPDFSAD